MERRIERTIFRVASVIGLAWLGSIAAITARQSALLFRPVRCTDAECPASPCHVTEPVTLTSSDGTRLCGWLLTPNEGGPHASVIYFGGRAEEVSWVARDAANMFPDMIVLAINYRGYGDSHGKPGERQMIEDGKLLFDWLIAHGKGSDPHRVAIVGRSLGSGVAIQVAAHRPVAALVLLTPFDSVLAMVKTRLRSMPVALMLRHRFESIRFAPLLSAPTMVLRAEADEIVPHRHTDALVSQLTTLKDDQIVPGSDHFNIPYLPETQQRIAGFLRHHLLRRSMDPQQRQERRVRREAAVERRRVSSPLSSPTLVC